MSEILKDLTNDEKGVITLTAFKTLCVEESHSIEEVSSALETLGINFEHSIRAGVAVIFPTILNELRQEIRKKK